MSHNVATSCSNDNTKRDSVAFFFESDPIFFWMCLDRVFVSIFDFLCVVGGGRRLAATPAGCTRGGSRSCPIQSTLRGRCSSERANVLTCAVKIHRQVTPPGWSSRLREWRDLVPY